MDSMMYVEKLLKKALRDECDGIYSKAISTQRLNDETLRDFCMDLGEYVSDDEIRPGYVIRIERRMHNAVIMALCYDNGMLYVACKSDNGFLSRNSEKKAVDHVKKKLNDCKDEKISNNPSEESSVKTECSGKRVMAIIILAIVIIFVGVGLFCLIKIIRADKYNEIIINYNEIVKEYDKLLLDSSVDELDGFPEHVAIKDELPTGLNAVMIDCDIDSATNDLEKLLGQYVVLGQITNPPAEVIKHQIKKVEGIGDVQEVTINKDPNEMLGKENGYTGCVYFSHELVDKADLLDGTVIDIGTDGGGCVEIFKNRNDAKLRNEYLTEFDDTLLYSGYHRVFGTLVIRVSYKLSDENQLVLANAISDAIINIDSTDE